MRPLRIAGWATVVPLLLVALARVVAWDSRSVLVALNSLTPVLYLPAWIVAIGAGVGRRWTLAAVAGVVVVAHVTFLLPELLAAEGLPAAIRSAPTFTVFNANVQVGNNEIAALADEVRGSRPDIVVLQESTPAFVARLDATGALAELPHRHSVPRTDPFAALVASRWPLGDVDVLSAGDRPAVIRATVDVGGTTVRVYAVHVVAPFGGSREEWIEGHRRLSRAIATEPHPVLVAGDFNATWHHEPFRRLLHDADLTDAAAARGDPLHMTWPRNLRLIPPLTRIDHILTTQGLAVTKLRTGNGKGSDHEPLIAAVAIQR